MTSSEVKTGGSLYHLTAKKMGTEPVTRKASFKCPVPNKAASQRITRKVVLPMSTVQALTFKFNELSQMNQSQKNKITQNAVKNMLNANGKQSTIKVVICRKPSASKHKKPEDLVVRKRVSIKKFQSEPDAGKEMANIHKNVLQKISEYEEMKKAEENSIPIKNRIAKMQVPKILVDIDLGVENCKTNHLDSTRNNATKRIICDENVVSVKSAINLFENNSHSCVVNKKPLNDHNQTLDGNSPKEHSDKENSLEVKAKPIAAIKPILKKSEDKTVKKTKLSPKDSLNRKKYISMKRELARESENSEKEKESKEEINPAKETEKRLENNSSLHKHILQSNQNLVAKEIPLNDDKPLEESVINNQSLKPNTSFLWSRKDETSVEKRLNRMNLPLPVPPENFIPNIIEKEDTIYDDVRPMSQESEDEGFEKLTDSDDDTYDDVGIYWRNNESNGKQSNKNDLQTEVKKKNMINELSSTKILEEKYFYDDGEGERYQYISDKSETLQSNKSNDLEIYQYIQNTNDDFNIYEDIQSIKSQLTSKDKAKDIYEDINCVEDSVTDNHSINNCYESVYNGIYSRNNESQPYIKSDVSDTSNTSGRSTYEKSNSLYGMSAGNVADNENGIILGSANDCLNSGVYHATLYEPPRPNSETSQSNSDEWIEVSESEPEETVYLVHERPKKQRSGGGTWTQKERRRWKRLQKKAHLYEEENRSQNSDDHLYESVGNYDSADITREENTQALPGDQLHHFHQNQIISDDQYIDDFDSQSSGDEAYINTKLPDVPPNHGYNITKSLKAAGKKIRKNFSLRKSDISKSLKRFKKSSRPKIDEAVFVANKEPETDVLPKPESPSTPTNLNNSIYSNNSDSAYSSHNFTKSNSSGDIKSPRHRKSWTFRSKFKSSSSLDASENSQIIDANRNSTFYLSLNEVEPRKIEKRDELLNEMQSVLSQRGGNSLDNVSEKVDKDSNNRHSDNLSTTKPRPNVPPPPPPALSKIEIATEKTKYSDILWGEKSSNNSLYVESGLFDKQKKHSRCADSDTSLYAEIGLYAATDVLTQKKTQMFVDEPLYQFYTECVNQRARDDILNNYDSEGYEEINDFYSVINEKRRTIDIKNVRPNFEDFNDDVRPEVTSFRSILDKRTLWCQIPAVIDSCILETLSEQARKLQEAKFEILTSEGSYMNSLNVLESHFMKKVGDLNMITKRDFRILFSNIVAVKKCSENFLEDLENCWKNNIMLNGICDIVYKHATTSFQVYTKYCKNQICIYRTLRELIDKNANFESALKEIENDPVCQNLNIHSFLMLPMQRITRLPLLMGAVLARLDKSDDEFEICKASFDVLNKIVQDCDDEARRMEKCEEMLILSQQIEFPKDIRRIPIITGSRFLVKSGQVTQLVNRDENKLTFGKKFSKVSLTLFLFTDLLIVAKRKNVRNYVVVDHCPRNLVQMQTTDGLSQLPVKLNTNSESGSKLLMLLTMLENHEKKTVEMILSFEMESDRQRWLDAVTPKLSENPNECIYEEWDCPQVISLYEFTPSQPDELNLCIGDVVNVLKKMNDGWYQGERLRDGARGWFPQNHTQEISSSHVRAKNKKLRYKLLALSGNLIDSQKMNGK